MRVLHVIPTLDHRSGGPALALVGLSKALVEQGVEVVVLIDRPDPDDRILVDDVTTAGVRVVGADGRGRGALDAEVQACDVCHIHAVWEGILHRAAARCRAHSRPYLFRPCGMLDPWCLALRPLKKRAYIALRLRRDLDASAAIHFTTAVERDLVRPLGFRAPTLVVPNGVDLGEMDGRPRPGSFRAAHPELGDRPLILFLSRVHPKKGIDLLIRGFARMPMGDARLVIAGPDQDGHRGQLEALAKAEGVAERVLFTGMLRGPDRLAALGDADLFVLPSHQENFGVAVVESLACGTPVIVSDQVNIHGAITSAGVGGVVPLDAAALSDAMRTWLEDAPRREEAARRAPELVRAHYAWSTIAAGWVDRYRAFAEGRRPDDATT